MKQLLIAGLVVAGAVLAATPAGAQTKSPVHVAQCRAELNEMTSGGYYGFTPGYYPAGRYYYNTAYNYRYYQPPVTTTSPSLHIDYTNSTQETMKSIEFGLVANGNLVAEVRDVGTFSPGVEIKHRFGISQNVFPLQTSLARCVPLRITYENGKQWTNPHLPAMNHKLSGMY